MSELSEAWKLGKPGIALFLCYLVGKLCVYGWKVWRGTWISYDMVTENKETLKELLKRIDVIEKSSILHLADDTAQFAKVNAGINSHIKNLETVTDRVHSYTSSVRDDIKSVMAALNALSIRVDEIWSFLGKSK